MNTKEDLQRLIDELPRREFHAVRRFVEFLCSAKEDLVLKALREAPMDDEPETAEEAAAVRKAREELKRGKGIPHEEVLRRLGHAPRR